MDTEKKTAPAKGNGIGIKASDEALAGKYANLVKILHTKEEFVVDFLNVFPPSGTLNSRIIMSPGHFKRMLVAMQANLKAYESRFGDLTPSKEPEHRIGFQEREEEGGAKDTETL